MTHVVARSRLFYVGLGIVWPGVVALVFFMVRWDDPPSHLALLVYAGVQVWLYELAFTLAAFVALWIAMLVLGSNGRYRISAAARLFFWTSLIVSPLALMFLVLSS